MLMSGPRGAGYTKNYYYDDDCHDHYEYDYYFCYYYGCDYPSPRQWTRTTLANNTTNATTNHGKDNERH